MPSGSTRSVAIYSANNQSSPFSESAGKALHQQVCVVSPLLKALLAKCRAAVACKSAQATSKLVQRLGEALCCPLNLVQDFYPLSAAPMCCTGFPVRQAVLRAAARKSRDIMRSNYSMQGAGYALNDVDTSRVRLRTRRSARRCAFSEFDQQSLESLRNQARPVRFIIGA